MVTRRSDAILARLMQLHPKVIDLSLGRTLELLEKLGRPQDKLPPVVHVAGTNGKGSTIAYLRCMLEEAGYRVHVYTSPHLVTFAERIRLAGEQISEAALSALLEDCEKVNGGEPITFFEITTCAAMKAFADTPGDIVLLETGLGGRLDSTNVVESPACTILTPISMDHTQFLGDTLEAITREKAAIQKADVPSVVGPQPDSAMEVIEERAREVNAPLARAGAEWSITETENGLRFTSVPVTLDLPKPGLPGRHQTPNAGAAVAAALELRDQGFEISDEHIRAGIANATWPARLQRLTTGPIVDAMGETSEVWLDGGHNAAAGEALADMAQTWSDKPLYIIFGMLNTKAAGDFLRPLAPHVTQAWSIAIPGEENSLTAGESEAFAKGQGIDCTAMETVEDALSQIPKDKPARLLICGSLYLAGVILSENG
ncbi:bifunctional folylpolyglutamate synthase/dihydrofolate synthase [Aestuariispira ectoiniformans]|uniref:bifunctional folylpolyglutamate synthase/dihydrofolate synthase n=1 Tax=Aestuariispira ectoiniformans TaxID=2775080 RepID=UPI00223B65B5|nr:folylpolyglutamate synthase/dihydrofolate synthase family protein [Aestuariispira ectoiniformans]